MLNLDEIKLVNGTSRSEGRIEILRNQTWGTICGNDSNAVGVALVVCRQAGFAGLETVFRDSSEFGEGNGTVHPLTCMGGK